MRAALFVLTLSVAIPSLVWAGDNPLPHTRKAIAQGRGTYVRYCASCHGNDGKAQVDVVADATDLTNPKVYTGGTSDSEIFRSIREGRNASMPAFASQLKTEQEVWNLVHYIRSLWPESLRPAIQPEAK
jgi:mono/diheme cytochrome c family protein